MSVSCASSSCPHSCCSWPSSASALASGWSGGADPETQFIGPPAAAAEANMNFKTTYWLFAALLGVLVIFAVKMLFFGPSKTKGDPTLVFPTLAEVKAADIDRVEIDRVSTDKDKQTVFVRQGAGWHMTTPMSARVEASAVDMI